MSEKKIDHAALIAEARGYQSFAFDAEETGYALIIRALADALEAAQPQGEYHEGLEEGIKIGRAETAQQAPRTSVQEVLELLDAFHGDNRMSYDAYANLHDAVALLDVQQAPAVDTDSLVAEIRAAYVDYSESADFPTTKHYLEWKLSGGAEAEFDRMIAEVEARGLEKAADEWADSIGHVNNNQHSHIAWEAAEVIRARAQQVREGN